MRNARARKKSDSPSPPPPPVAGTSRASRSTANLARQRAQSQKNARIAASMGIEQTDSGPVSSSSSSIGSSARSHSSATPRRPPPTRTASTGRRPQLTMADFDFEAEPQLPPQLLADMAANPGAATGTLEQRRALLFHDDPLGDLGTGSRRRQSRNAGPRTPATSTSRPHITESQKRRALAMLDGGTADSGGELGEASETPSAPPKKKANESGASSSTRVIESSKVLRCIFGSDEETEEDKEVAAAMQRVYARHTALSIAGDSTSFSTTTPGPKLRSSRLPLRNEEDEDGASEHVNTNLNPSKKTSSSSKMEASSKKESAKKTQAALLKLDKDGYKKGDESDDDKESDDDEGLNGDAKNAASSSSALNAFSTPSSAMKRSRSSTKKVTSASASQASSTTHDLTKKTTKRKSSPEQAQSSSAITLSSKQANDKKKPDVEADPESSNEKPANGAASSSAPKNKASSSRRATRRTKSSATEGKKKKFAHSFFDDDGIEIELPPPMKVEWNFPHPRPWELPFEWPEYIKEREARRKMMEEQGIVDERQGTSLEFDDQVYWTPPTEVKKKGTRTAPGNQPLCTSTPTKKRGPKALRPLSVSPVPTDSPESTPEPRGQMPAVRPHIYSDDEDEFPPSERPKFSLQAATKCLQDMLRDSSDDEPVVKRPEVYTVVKVPTGTRRPFINRDGRDNLMAGFRLPSPKREHRILLTGHSTESLLRIKAKQEAEAAKNKTGMCSDSDSDFEKSESEQPCTSSAPSKPRKIVCRKAKKPIKKASSSTPRIRGFSKRDLEIISQSGKLSTPSPRARPLKAVYTPAPMSDESEEEEDESKDVESEDEIVDPEEEKKKKLLEKMEKKKKQQKIREQREEEKRRRREAVQRRKAEARERQRQRESDREMREQARDYMMDRQDERNRHNDRVAKAANYEKVHQVQSDKRNSELRKEAAQQKKELAAIRTPHRHSKRIKAQVKAKVDIVGKPRERSKSVPPRASKDLLPFSTSKAEPLQAHYAVSFNKTLSIMNGDLTTFLKYYDSYIRELSKPGGSLLDYNLYQDPFLDARNRRHIAMRDKYMFGFVHADMDCKLPPDELLEEFDGPWLRQDSLKPRTEWKYEDPNFGVVQIAKNLFKFRSIADSGLPTCDDIAAIGRKNYINGVRSIVHKVMLTMQAFLARNPDEGLSRVGHYLMNLAKKEEDQDPYLELTRDCLFLLPIHIGDLKGKCHVPRKQFIGLAMEIFLIILNDWPNTFRPIPKHDFVALCKMEAAALRLGGTHGPAEDRFQMARAKEHIATWMIEVEPRPPAGMLMKQPIDVSRPRLRRHKSFSEFTHVLDPPPKELSEDEIRRADFCAIGPHSGGYI